MQQINIHFYHELNDFLPPQQRDTDITCDFLQSRSVKDLIESLGVPHTEIDLILLDGVAVGFDYLIHSEDSTEKRIRIYPPLTTEQKQHEGLCGKQLKHLQPPSLDENRFVLDVHLGRLAAYLRMLGFDTLYRNDYPDEELADITAGERRILLTCDRQLLMRNRVVYGYFVRSRVPRQQLKEIVSRFDLYREQKPFTRCMHCNGRTRPVDKPAIESQLLEKTKKYYDEFYRCDNCGKVYWKGSHFQKMQALVDNIRANKT